MTSPARVTEGEAVARAGRKRGPAPTIRVREEPDPAWLLLAACKGDPGGLFMDAIDLPAHGQRSKQVTQRCKDICRRCPVRNDCLEWALGIYGPQYGVLGGLDADEREAIIRGPARLRREA